MPLPIVERNVQSITPLYCPYCGTCLMDTVDIRLDQLCSHVLVVALGQDPGVMYFSSLAHESLMTQGWTAEDVLPAGYTNLPVPTAMHQEFLTSGEDEFIDWFDEQGATLWDTIHLMITDLDVPAGVVFYQPAQFFEDMSLAIAVGLPRGEGDKA